MGAKEWARRAQILRDNAAQFQKEGNYDRAKLFEETARDADRLAAEGRSHLARILPLAHQARRKPKSA